MKNNNKLSPNTMAFYNKLKDLYTCALKENKTNIIKNADGKWWYVSYETLADFMGTATETVKRHMKVLLKDGCVETLKVSRGNAYKIQM